MTGGRSLIALAVALALTAGLRDAWDDWVAATVLPPVLAETSVEVRARDGTLLRAYPVEDGRQRLAVALADVDPTFVQMLIAYEDKRFASHNGVDLMALVRAVGQAAWNGDVVSGGSTLTMQVARLLENSGTGRWAGKLRQMRVAWALERRLDKDQILTLYLQHAPYGGAVEGIQSGTRAWFAKPPKRLTPAESALLIALPQAPEGRRPDRNPAAALAARDRVLARLDLPATHAPVPLRMSDMPRLAPHVGDHLVARDPLTVRHDTTLNARLQSALEALAARVVRDQPRGVSTAILVADHQTGEILASVGSADYADGDGAQGFVDMTRALRSPGSTLKPLIYALAFDRGLAHPETIMPDRPTAFGTYAPQNFDGMFRGDITARHALQLSLNIPPVALTEALGPARLMAALRRSGATPVVQGQPGLAVALGGVGLTLGDLVQLYAALAEGGAGPRLHVEAEAPQAPLARLVGRAAAWQVGDILSDIPPPAGAGVTGLAYKTGTSYGHRDAWAIGYDGRHVIGVWMGRPDGTPVPGAFGGGLAAPVLFEAFGRLKSARDPLPPPPPETLIVPTARLPQPLQRFDARFGAVRSADTLTVAFPPSGAVLAGGDGLTVKMRGGQLPLTVLLNGAPVAAGLRQREVALALDGAGFSRISVVDAAGQSATVEVEVAN
ncbi:penicillin-binding protein 1C [Pseudosulfitobacter pseudonitzschiae]|uniref:penicillin-binding protein 1C n=1 Tax=Pseudosulfitobacter pseudonitzschiae TaxID=1402135 RepID=UPI001AF1FADD|nr:penicillin-binding protein 1C [Pseudosulfitobacter pseudonitzschiae]MBM1815737.1 penicillin-binding protein 1C [Pseudosulfitobacter pseudonitzschiae]MBM1832728.1 penicillin-binding protein 1C [Pseudosulfitobacter pseudonitzschiae]MBM1837596.1 penicillin-binding protein 1C [Pseudosulfitobacter pseudonitzschiae]MBM1842442.1 penicillin-binding protein 1C [Pseudosulfitobacter pseudonitzschiae]MBM1847310.1 penicillin-binding protein 1C [Pseudosulfitobacter pseudonitzschiae]